MSDIPPAPPVPPVGPPTPPAPPAGPPAPPVYAQPYPHAYAPVPGPPRGLSIASMVLGIAGIVLVFLFAVPSVLAVILGHVALKKEPAGRGMALAGLITGYIGIGILALIIVFGILFTLLPLLFIGGLGVAGIGS